MATISVHRPWEGQWEVSVDGAFDMATPQSTLAASRAIELVRQHGGEATVTVHDDYTLTARIRHREGARS